MHGETRNVLDFEFYHNLGYFHIHVYVCVGGGENRCDEIQTRIHREGERDVGVDIQF